MFLLVNVILLVENFGGWFKLVSTNLELVYSGLELSTGLVLV